MTELTFNLENGWWVCDYSGASGAIQIKFQEEAQVQFLGDAGLNEFVLLTSDLDKSCIYNTKHLLKYLNTTGLNAIRIKCSKEPIAIINTN